MKKMTKTLALLLALALVFGLSANAMPSAAALSDVAESRKDALLDEFFGDGITVEEAAKLLLEETATMEDYENVPFQYVPDENSYYVALGDDTVAGKNSNLPITYVDKLAADLQVPFVKLGGRQVTIKEICDKIADNTDGMADEVIKADLITIGWSNFNATYTMCRYLAGYAEKVTEEQWSSLVGEENMPLLRELLALMYAKMDEHDLSAFGSYDFKGGLECYAYTYMSNAIYQTLLIETIRQINTDAVIILVGTYNDLEGFNLTVSDRITVAEAINELVLAANLLSSRNAAHYRRVAYVDTPAVPTELQDEASQYTNFSQYLTGITVWRKGLPTDAGYAYIAQQIKASMTETCDHIWNEGEVAQESTCGAEGVLRYTCKWCGETKDEPIAATGEHTFGEWVVSGDIQTRTCQVCGHKEEKKAESGSAIQGDVNNDGSVNARDVRALLNALASGQELDVSVADINGDGMVNARDIRALLSRLAQGI